MYNPVKLLNAILTLTINNNIQIVKQFDHIKS